MPRQQHQAVKLIELWCYFGAILDGTQYCQVYKVREISDEPVGQPELKIMTNELCSEE